MALPVLTLSDFVSGLGQPRATFAADLVASFTEQGFVKLQDHGLSDETISQVFQWSMRFFDAPVEIRKEIANPPGPNPQRGWTGVGLESTSYLSGKGSMQDTKEHFDQGHAGDQEFPNRWPPEAQFPNFRAFMESFYEQCTAICLHLMEALELGFKIPRGSLCQRCIPSKSDLRLSHYPPISIFDMRSGSLTRISPHTDFGIISLLLQDDVGGLEIENRSRPGSFRPAPSKSNELIVNVSDTLQRWTNDRLLPGVHRVTIPHHLKGWNETMLRERFSVAYFFKADFDVSVGSLPVFVIEGDEKKYDDITALQLHQLRNQAMYSHINSSQTKA